MLLTKDVDSMITKPARVEGTRSPRASVRARARADWDNMVVPGCE